MDKYKDLNYLLKNYKVKKGQDYTHTSMIGGSYYIPDEKYDRADQGHAQYTACSQYTMLHHSTNW